MEKIETSEHCSLHRRYTGSFTVRVRVDAERRLNGVPCQKSRRGSNRSGESPSVITAIIMPIIRKLLDVAEGLTYLHIKHTIHGDLKGVSASSGSLSTVLISFYQSNILISRRGRARLTDFGFTSVVRGLNSVLVPELRGCTLRWAAPEIIRGESGGAQEADTYSFGMVVIEVSLLTSLHLVPDVEELTICLVLNTAQGLYRKVSVPRVDRPGRRLGGHGRRTARSPA